ncbi:SgcJ/EcaC family oxidoreductase [Kineosporia sp. J2-2]|uniref:SgcJ/EcaC family oxidoreductase n=1 Tax=Kineosporia corallincola TaxID=2835133 RepID=A0ABS5TGE1_9ACTN|nr:SgcJ/EcaC family oxidoreductase [Kineosporia corallincola]MBT0770157.1 SgcJ/EcaC family oxidoreductase [Kineosporia corallincola]
MDQAPAVIADVVRRMYEAWSTGDAAVFAADFAPDVQLVEVDGSVVKGTDAFVPAQQALFDTVLKGSRMVRAEVVSADLVGPGVGVVHAQATPLMAGEEQSPAGRRVMHLLVLAERDGRWQIVSVMGARVLSYETIARLDALGTS